MAKGHRQRLKERFLQSGLDDFNEINALELLLFYAIPQKDTNPIAHNLLDRFGSFIAVLDADYNDLLTVDGVSEHTAAFIKLIPQTAGYYQSRKISAKKALPTLQDIGDYLVGKYVGVTKETVYLMLLDNKRCLISCEKVYEGSVNSAGVSVRKLAEIALKKRAASVVLAHNHPDGLPLPSSDDLLMTKNMQNALATLEIEFLDHFIISENKYCYICNSGIT
ncbi:MAG: RadC family protein [Clostridia bacterium]|nr:RadC family protein [Clostridia bacterium]